MMENTRSKEFRYVYSGGFNLTFNGQDAIIRFGIKEGEAEILHEEVGVIIPPATMKLLGLLLSRTSEMIEKASGNQIPVDQSKLESVYKVISAAEDAALEKKNTNIS